MDNHPQHKSNSSGDNFTFPAMSPHMEMESELADHLFSNGKFLLHTFPIIQPRSARLYNLSRTSSVSSKDSLVSSRSSSTNSRTSSSSSCSSARTSTSEASAGVAMKRKIFPEKGSRSPVYNHCNNYHLPAQRWQFMAPVPMLNRRTSQRRKGEGEKGKGSPEKKNCSRRKGYCQRLFRWIVSTCKRCHAMEP